MKRLTAILAMVLAFACTARAESLEEARIRIAMAMARARASAGQREPAPNRADGRTDSPTPSYLWSRSIPGQLSLLADGRFVGAWREADGVYLSYPGWGVAELPAALPEGSAVNRRPFPLDTKTITDAADAGGMSGPKPAPVQSLNRIGTSAPTVGLRMPFGTTTNSRACRT